MRRRQKLRATEQFERAPVFVTVLAIALAGCGVDPGTVDPGAGGTGGEFPPPPRAHRSELEFAAQRLEESVATLTVGNYPRSSAANGTWRTKSSSDWTSGFWEGLLWGMHSYTGNADWSNQARAWTLPQSANQFNVSTHDVGFMLMTSYGLAYQNTQDASYRDVILNGAASLASRFDGKVGCIRSWDWGTWHYPVIIDNMMTLELLFYGAKLAGQPAWTNLALSHALKTMEHHFRPDGSTFHVVDYEPSTGAVLSQTTYQGAADTSTWSRGQAWAIYGFTMAYRYTHDPRMLETASKAANYFASQLPTDRIPYWDFQAPDIPNSKRDSSAAAIAASGLKELAAFTANAADRSRYDALAEAILASLSADSYLAKNKPPGILLHAVGGYPFNTEVDVSLIYGDYYFVQALLRSESGRVHDY